MTNTFEPSPFDVIRAVPISPKDEEDVVLAKLDLIHVPYKLLLFDCELIVDCGEAHVSVPDLRVLARYYLEPGFCGELDWETLLNQMVVAVCLYLGVPYQGNLPVSYTLYDFLASAGWQEWIQTHHIRLSGKEALLAYLAASAH